MNLTGIFFYFVLFLSFFFLLLASTELIMLQCCEKLGVYREQIICPNAQNINEK